jgi:hypothetical protein
MLMQWWMDQPLPRMPMIVQLLDFREAVRWCINLLFVLRPYKRQR